jgi:hypothetical protein
MFLLGGFCIPPHGSRRGRLPGFPPADLLVNAPLSSFAGRFGNALGLRVVAEHQGRNLQEHIHLPDRAAIADADSLISRFGEHAASEAARLASQSRALGNFVHYCRWRQIERMIARLATGPGEATLH